MFDQYEWEGSAFENSSKINNFADVTLAREDGQHGEEHKVILAGQVLFHYLTHSIITSTSAVGKRLQVLSCHISLYSGTCGR